MITLKLYLGVFLTATIALIRMVDCVGGLMFVQGPTSRSYQRVEDLYVLEGLSHREQLLKLQTKQDCHRCLNRI